MNEDYTIEKLEKTFREHSDQFDKDEEERLNKAMKEGRAYPIDRPFKLAEALHVICREINQLKNDLKLVLQDDLGISDEQLEICLKRLQKLSID